MSRPEDFLARAMAKEYRKASYPSHREHGLIIGGPAFAVVEPCVMLDPAGMLLAKMVLDASYRPSVHRPEETRIKPVIRVEPIKVPAYLAERGVVAVDAGRPAPKHETKHVHFKSSSSMRTMTIETCRVPDCGIAHAKHYCGVCKWDDVSHTEEECRRRRDG